MHKIFRRPFQLNRKINLLRPVSCSITGWGAQNGENSDNTRKIFYGTVCVVTLTSFGIYKYFEKKGKRLVHAATNDTSSIGTFKPDLPSYTLDEVMNHTTSEKGIWVIYKQGVYDITDFVPKHPGGDKIMMAAGSFVEPFWLMYGIHNDEKILNMTEKMRIGNISAEEAKEATDNMTDPYINDPRRHPILKSASMKPYNAEPVPTILVDSFITPNELFYVRNHLPVPVVDPKTYELEIEVEGTKKIISLSLEDLKKYPKHTVTATVMCAGNRRGDMTKVKPVKGLYWGSAAIANATWSGARLRDVLNKVGVTENQTQFKHVQFEGLDTDPTNSPYGSSITFHKAMDQHGDVILAYEMNGVNIPRDHGYPVRVIVPGIVGARNVKWLAKIIVSENESEAFWQQNDYKGFSPSVDWDTVDFTKSPAIQELPVISAICVPQAGETVEAANGFITVKGYAWSGGGNKIIRVDVTANGGKTWHVANIDIQDSSPAPKHWSWTLWTAKIPVEKNTKKVEIWAKAVDSSYNTQPESFENIWNLRGVLSNAYHRVPVNIK